MNETTDATAIFAPLWRRKWLILVVGILVAAATYLYYKHQPTVYTATTQVYLGGGAEEQAQLNSTPEQSDAQQPRRHRPGRADQLELVGEAVHHRLRAEHHRAARPAARSRPRQPERANSSRSRPKRSTAGRGAARQRVRRRPTSNARTPTTARGRKRDRRHAHASCGASKPAVAARRQGQSERQGRRRERCRQRRRHDPGGEPQQQDQPARIATSGSRGCSRSTPAKTKADAALADAAKQRDLRLRDRPAAGRARRLRARPLRPPAALAGEHRSGLRDADPDRAARRRDAGRAHRDGRAGAGRGAAASRCGGCRPRCSSATCSSATARRPPRSILFLSADAGDGKSTLVADLALVQREAGERVAVVEADFRRPVQGGLLGVERPATGSRTCSPAR